MRSATQLQPDPNTATVTVTNRSVPSPTTPAPRDEAAVKELDRTAAAVVAKANNAGVHIEYLGVEPLRQHAELYTGTAPWVVCPAHLDPLVEAGLPIPSKQRATLDQLVQAGMNFPHLYFAHEVPKNIAMPSTAPDADGTIALADHDIARMVVRPDSPAAARKTAERLENATLLVARSAAKAGAAAAMIAAAPLLLLDGLDPAVLGAITRPQDRSQATPPAAFFLLTHWDW
jgi:hypothetical protein